MASTSASRPDPRRSLWAVKDPAIDAALRAALGTCRHEERLELVRVMLERRDLACLVAVVESQDAAGPEEEALVRAAAALDLDGALRTLIGRASGTGTRHALRLVREARLGRLAYLLTELIRRGRDGLGEEAAKVLVELCDVSDAASRSALRSAVDTAVARFDRHRHPGVLEAYLKLLPAPMPAAQGALTSEGHPAVLTLGERLAAAATPVDRRALLPLCACPPLHPAVRAGLTRCHAAPRLAEALAHGHLLAEASVRQMLRNMAESDAASFAVPDVLTDIPAEVRRWVPALWACLPLESGVLISRLARVADDADPGTRVAALRVLASVKPDDTLRQPWADLLIRFAHDADAGIARAAAAVLDRAASPLARPTTSHPSLSSRSISAQPAIALATMSQLATSPHAAVRDTAGRRIGPGAFDRVWKQWEQLEPGRRAATLFALRKLDPGFDGRLLRRLREPDLRRDPNLADPRLRALAWVRALACPSGPLADFALALTGDAEPRVAASAVMAAALSDQPGATDLLHRLTRHRDARVRANAVEALDQRLTPAQPNADASPATIWPAERLARLIADEAPRVRANALLALFRREGQPALRPLADMLRDPRPDHRRSALWLAGVTGLIDATKIHQPTDDLPTVEAQTAPFFNASGEPLDDDTVPPPGVIDLLNALDDAIDQARGAAA